MLNVHGADVERSVGRSVMPALHGLWSGGCCSAPGSAPSWPVAMPLGPHLWLLLAFAVANTIGTSSGVIIGAGP